MPTVDSREVILEMLQNNGTYPGDPQMFSIWTYVNDWGNRAYKLIYGDIPIRKEIEFVKSPYVHNPYLLWSQSDGLEPVAEEFFPELKNE